MTKTIRPCQAKDPSKCGYHVEQTYVNTFDQMKNSKTLEEYDIAKQAFLNASEQRDNIKGKFNVITFDNLKATVTPEDLDYAQNRILVDFRNLTDNSWDKIMGSDVRKTKNNLEQYDKKLQEIAETQQGYQDTLNLYAQANAVTQVYARAFKQNIHIPPEAEKRFKDIWEGKKQGFSGVDLQSQLQRNQESHEALAQDQISPAAVIGNSYIGNTRKLANEYLDKNLKSIKEAIATQGRSSSVNISNVKYHLRSIEEAALVKNSPIIYSK